jgi:hypothetical protein
LSVRPCSRPSCGEVFLTELESKETPFVRVWVGGRDPMYYGYCCPRCASLDLTERFYPKVLP